MSSSFLARGSALFIAIALVTGLGGQASAQCIISGPTTMCSGGSAQLCGDNGPYDYEWTGPDGFSATTQCIFATAPGTYSLRVFDQDNGLWFGPCTQTITVSQGPTATISGPTTGCAGGSVQLSGPGGNVMYAWSGPNGFAAFTQNITVSQSGTYQLVCRDPTTGCEGAPASQTVTFTAGPSSSISGPTTGCSGSTVQLCGPTGNLTYLWTGPNGFNATTSCVNVSQTGVYSLVVSDATTGCAGAPTTQTVTFGSGPTSSISGPSSGCLGSPVQLCGPTGNLGYHWTGPNNFSALTSCVNVTDSGTYSLVVTDATTGCVSAPVSQSVAFATCPVQFENCPRTASFWTRQCAPHNPALFPFDPDQVAAVAACVDDRSHAFTWGAGCTFRSTLQWTPPCNVRKRAKRQFAALLANVCAEVLELQPHTGQYVGLDPSTPLNLPGVSSTIGAWASAADGQLVVLEQRSLNDPNVRNAYREIVRVAWNVNHGLGIGPVCSSGTNNAVASVEPVSGDDGDVSVDPDDASLLLATADDAVPQLVLEQPWPNPFSSSASVAYTVSTAGAQDVVIVIHDISGRVVRELVNGQMAPGRYEVQWDGRTTDGSLARNGVYFVSGRVGGQPVQARLTLLH